MDYLTLEGRVTAEFTLKHSKFIANLANVNDYEEAIAFIKEIKKLHSKATHNCIAWILLPPNEESKFSDDGEPQGTAGKPMLDVLAGNSLKGIAAVVSRYFGGVKLGKGGLVQAYQMAVKAALEKAKIIKLSPSLIAEVLLTYGEYDTLKSKIEILQTKTLDIQYGDFVTLKLAFKEEDKEKLENILQAVMQKDVTISIMKKENINYN